jgi:hypothetical protein
MSRLTLLSRLRIEPVLVLEAPGMFDDGAPYPADRSEVQARFRRAVAGTGLAKVPFVPGSDLLLRARDLVSVVGDLARLRATDVSTIGEAELAGGYAFTNLAGDGTEPEYVFGVEDDSTLLDTASWSGAVDELVAKGKTRVRHACDHFIAGKLEDEMLVLTHERSTRQYLMKFDRFKDCIARADEELRTFAVAFVPEYERELARSLPPDKAHLAALDSFSNRPGWFGQPG